MSEAWTQWQGQIIDSKFLLQQHLGGSGESAVFLAVPEPADPRSHNLASDTAPERVAIRLIADCPNPELQLSRWRMVQGLSHPNLLRLIETGRCRLGEIDLIYAVMEYAEENLAQVIPERALTAEEGRQMLDPALEALVYLHGKGLVHGHLKPANFMAIRDELKLASDGIYPGDEQSAAAADVWSLGVTLAEVLTQHLPVFQENVADPLLPQGLPVEFVEIVRGCLRYDLRLRWTIPAIRQRLHAPVVEPMPVVLQASTPQPLVNSLEAAPTFAEALRPRPVASQSPTPLVKVAAVAVPSASVDNVGALALEARSSAAVPQPQTAAPISTIPPLRVVQNSDHAETGVRERLAAGPSRAEKDSRALAPVIAMPGRPLLATMIAQAKPIFSRTVSQARLVAQRLASLASRAILFVAAQVEKALRRVPEPRLQRVALTGVIVFAVVSVLYFAFGLLRHKPAADSAREQKTPAPKVIIVNQPQRPSPKKHSPAKPSPKVQSQGQAGSVQPEVQPAPQPSTSTQRQTAPQAPAAQNVALRSRTQQGVREIDDGGAADDAPATSSAGVSTGTAARFSGANTTVNGTQQILPEVSQSALRTIHGTVRVSVRVRVDPSGNVARAELTSAGPSRYFARKSLEAAQNWKFASGAGSPFVVHFEFTHNGTRAFASRMGS